MGSIIWEITEDYIFKYLNLSRFVHYGIYKYKYKLSITDAHFTAIVRECLSLNISNGTIEY